MGACSSKAVSVFNQFKQAKSRKDFDDVKGWLWIFGGVGGSIKLYKYVRTTEVLRSYLDYYQGPSLDSKIDEIFDHFLWRGLVSAVDVICDFIDFKDYFETHLENGRSKGSRYLYHLASQGIMDMAEYLIEKGVDLANCPVYEEISVFHIACRYGKVDMVDLLLPFFDTYDPRNNGEQTVIEAVIFSGEVSILDRLIINGIDLDQPSQFGLSPIAYAIYQLKIDIINRLLEMRVRINKEEVLKALNRINRRSNRQLFQQILSLFRKFGVI